MLSVSLIDYRITGYILIMMKSLDCLHCVYISEFNTDHNLAALLLQTPFKAMHYVYMCTPQTTFWFSDWQMRINDNLN